MMKRNDAIKLFLEKEGKELRGKRNFNFFVLVAIFAVAIFSIGFGSASLKYLQFKMEDPFINWIDIIARQKVFNKAEKIPLDEFLKDSTLRSEIQFEYPEDNYILNIDFRHQTNGKNVQLQGRSISAGSSILPKILDKSNVVVMRDSQVSFKDTELGIIITQATLNDLGYADTPPFVYLALSFDDASCQDLEVPDGLNGNYPVAFPVFAVVKQLPGMNSFLFSKRILQEYYATNKTAFDITSEENSKSLDVVGEEENIDAIMQDISSLNKYEVSKKPYDLSWQNLYKISITDNFADERLLTYNRLYNHIANAHPEVTRVYDFQQSLDSVSFGTPAYYSVQIKDLANIKRFQTELYEKCGIKLEMTSVEQKSNFQFVQKMGNILSVCIIFIAVLFICFFIYFMLSTHFQRIQRNLGTFKAFGISNSTLYYIYIVLLVRITLAAFVIAFALTWICNQVLNLLIQIESGYNWIEVLVWQNLLLLFLAVLAAIIASFWVARTKLRHTPGDLIYNRNNQ